SAIPISRDSSRLSATRGLNGSTAIDLIVPLSLGALGRFEIQKPESTAAIPTTNAQGTKTSVRRDASLLGRLVLRYATVSGERMLVGSPLADAACAVSVGPATLSGSVASSSRVSLLPFTSTSGMKR